jgi:transglutaminase-like putative cysteine protease
MSAKSAIAATIWAALVLAVLPGLCRAQSSETPLRSVELHYAVSVPDIPADAENVYAWVPVPQTSLYQTVHGYTVAGDYYYKEVAEPEYGNRFLMFDLSSAAGGDAEFTVTYSVDRKKVDSNTGYDTDMRMLDRYLMPDAMIPVSGPFVSEAHEVAGSLRDPLAQARALYDNIVKTVIYDKPEGGKHGRGDAIFACNERYGNCTDFHSLFIGEARSLGIPARFHMGIPFPMDQSAGEIGGYHCWAEFFIEGYGWIPIDASEANKNKARTDELFGGLDASRVAFTTGRDFIVPGSKKGRVNFFIYPLVEADGVEITANKSFSFNDR